MCHTKVLPHDSEAPCILRYWLSPGIRDYLLLSLARINSSISHSRQDFIHDLYMYFGRAGEDTGGGHLFV